MVENGTLTRPAVTRIDGVAQVQIPAYAGHRSGYAFAVVNDTDVTQTILGPAHPADFVPFEGDPRSSRFEVSTENTTDPSAARLTYSSAPAVLAPHTARVVRVSDREPCAVAGDTETVREIGIRVRVGAFTHTDEIALSPAVGIKRALTPGCPANGRP